MKRHLSILASLVLVFSFVLAISVSADTVKPGDAITVEIPFSSANPILALQINYTISSGLQFISASNSGGMTGSASASKAVYISMGGVTSGTVTLHLMVKADAAGEQTVAVTSVKGGSSGESSSKLIGSVATYNYTILSTAMLTTAPANVATAVPTIVPTAVATSVPIREVDDDRTGTRIITPTPMLNKRPTPVPTKMPTPFPSDMPASPLPQRETEQDILLFDAPEGFEVLKAAAVNVPKHYTAILIPGISHTFYAFTDKDGATQFRVYGRLNKIKGMYEAKVLSMQAGEALVLSVKIESEKPIKDKLANRAEAKPVALDNATHPEGYQTTSKKGVLYFTNLFRQKEYRVLGRIPGIENAYYPAVNGRPRIGSLAIDLEGDKERMKDADGKYYKVPKEYREGFAVRVYITTSDGAKVTVWTDKPILDKTKLN